MDHGTVWKEVKEMKVQIALQRFFARYGEKAAGSASWRGAYEAFVPETLKKKVLAKKEN